MNNTLTALNNYLFEQIERLNDDELSEIELDKEIRRSDSITKVARTIIENGELALKAKKHVDEFEPNNTMNVPMLGIEERDA